MVRKKFSLALHIFLPLFLFVIIPSEAWALAPSTAVITPSTVSALPLKHVYITSKFGFRKHPVLKQKDFHGGIDLRAQLNDEVTSISDGIVTSSGPRGALGNAVFISHPALKATSVYGHLNKVAVQKGQRLKAGTVIGYAGTTGRSTGVHLHLTIKESGRNVEPISFLSGIDKIMIANSSLSRKSSKKIASPKAAPRLTIAIRRATPNDQNIASASHKKFSITDAWREAPQIATARSTVVAGKIAHLNAEIEQAAASAEQLKVLYSEGIVARKKYVAEETRVNQLRNALRELQSST